MLNLSRIVKKKSKSVVFLKGSLVAFCMDNKSLIRYYICKDMLMCYIL